MRNLYNMSIPSIVKRKVSLTEQSSEKFRTALRKVKGSETEAITDFINIADIKVIDNASVGTIDLASIVIKDATEDVKVVNKAIVEQLETQDVDVPNFFEFEDLKVVELREILDNKGIKYTATKKVDLVELVRYS